MIFDLYQPSPYVRQANALHTPRRTQCFNGYYFVFFFTILKSSIDKYDITFLDWQVVRCGTVAIDLSYFIFCCTDADVRKRLPDLMRIYHNQLIQRINELGSNGKALFPYEKLEWHMKKYAKFGLGKVLIHVSRTSLQILSRQDVLMLFLCYCYRHGFNNITCNMLQVK